MKKQVYALKDPRTGRVRYVGATAMGLEARLSKHLHDAKHLHESTHTLSPKVKWIKQLQARNIAPVIVLLEDWVELWQESERLWIKHFRSRYRYPQLTNVRDGGDGSGGWKHSEKTRALLRASAAGRKYPNRRPKSPEARAKIGAALRGRTRSPEAIAKTAAFWTGRTHSEETKRKISETRRKMFEARRVVP